MNATEFDKFFALGFCVFFLLGIVNAAFGLMTVVVLATLADLALRWVEVLLDRRDRSPLPAEKGRPKRM